MSYGGVMKFPVLLLLSSIFLKINGDVYYSPEFTDSVYSCENYENEFLDCDELVLGSSKGDEGEEAAKLSGFIKTKKEISSDYNIVIEIWKILELGDEYMYHAGANLCDSMKNTDTPWFPILEMMNITECPIPVKVFEVKGLTVSLESLKSVLTHDFCGNYRVEMSFVNVTEKVSCHVLELCIVELDDCDE